MQLLNYRQLTKMIILDLQAIHDSVHDAVGGTGGHMKDPDVAAFDPSECPRILDYQSCSIQLLLAEALVRLMHLSEA
jgi:hypothetical protein